MPLSEKTIEVVKATAPVVGAHAEEITSNFYGRLFTEHPELLKTFFNRSHQKKKKQPRTLADAVVAYATHIDKLDDPAVGALVARMAHRHCALSVKPEFYKIVYTNVMAAIAEVLADAVTEEIANAWSEAILALADICINAEEALYQAGEKRTGGWRYDREFIVKKKELVAANTVRLTFVPADGYDGGFEFTTGQYISVRCPGLEAAPRHYTITSAPGAKMIEITCRLLQDGEEKGEMSSYLHQNVQVGEKVLLAPPFGVFTPAEEEKEVAFISAGIGCTPMLAFLRHFGENAKTWFHVEKNLERDVLHHDREQLRSIDIKTHYTEGSNRPDLKKEAEELIGKVGAETTFYICGPTDFMDQMKQALEEKGAKNIRYEIFGTGTIETNRETEADKAEKAAQQAAEEEYDVAVPE